MTPIELSTFFLGFIVIIAVALFVAAPLFRGAEAETAMTLGERARWQQRKRQALAAIKEVELDHQMGKLSDEDLASQRSRFEVQAMEAIAALEAPRK